MLDIPNLTAYDGDVGGNGLIRWILPMALLGAGWGCSALQQRLAVRNLQVVFSQAEITHLDLSGATLLLTFRAYNPNTVQAILDGFSFSLEANNQPIASGKTRQSLRIPPRETRSFQVDVVLPWKGLSSAMVQALKNRSARLKAVGTAHVHTPLGDVSFRVVEYAREFR